MINALRKPVFTASAKPKNERRRLNGISASAFKGGDGRWHTYLNCDVPRETSGHPISTMDDSVCKRCGYGYSHVMRDRREICEECIIEAIACHAQGLQDEYGIDLGWPKPSDYSPSEQALWQGYKAKTPSQIDASWRARGIKNAGMRSTKD